MRRSGYFGNVLTAIETGSSSLDISERAGHEMTGINFKTPLRGREALCRLRKSEDIGDTVGGLRRPSRALNMNPGSRDIGYRIRSSLFSLFDASPKLIQICCSAIGSDDPHAGPNEEQLRLCRQAIALVVGASEWEPVHSIAYNTSVRPGLLGAWRLAAADPDDQPEKWCRFGAPAGVREHPIDRDIFPTVEPEVVSDPEMLTSDYDSFTNYDNVDSDEDAAPEISRLIAAGFVLPFDSLDDCTRYLGEKPVLSKIGLIVKMRAGKMKKRIVLDAKRSGISGSSTKLERVILPRATDPAWDMLDLMSKDGHAAYSSDDDYEWLVLDFADAFWMIPLLERERRFFVAKFRGRYLVFLRVAQGSRGAPLIWCRVAALVMRLTASTFLADEARLQCYVDDPILAMRGSRWLRDRLVALVVVIWRCLGFPLSFRKGQRGSSVTWIAASLSVKNGSVSCGVKEEIVRDVKALTAEILQSNLVSTKQLRSYTGKVQCVASLVFMVRPFLQPLWAVLAAGSVGSNAPMNTVWVRQITHSLLWIFAFLSGTTGPLVRELDLDAYLRRGQCVEISMDASPWGMGACLFIDHLLVEYIAEPITTSDAKILGHSIGDSASQQTFEAFIALISLRHWASFWRKRRVVLHVRSDSVAALTLMLHMKIAGTGTGLIAREVALDVAHAVYRPDVVEHIPGIANVTCDSLSRLHMSGSKYKLPACLEDVLQARPCKRDRTYFRSLEPPPLISLLSAAQSRHGEKQSV